MQEYWVTGIRKDHGRITRLAIMKNTKGSSLVHPQEMSVGEAVEHMLKGDHFYTAMRQLGAHGELAHHHTFHHLKANAVHQQFRCFNKTCRHH